MSLFNDTDTSYRTPYNPVSHVLPSAVFPRKQLRRRPLKLVEMAHVEIGRVVASEDLDGMIVLRDHSSHTRCPCLTISLGTATCGVTHGGSQIR